MKRETVIKTLGWRRKKKRKNDIKGLVKARFGDSECGG
jgi:hypothetical protein